MNTKIINLTTRIVIIVLSFIGIILTIGVLINNAAIKLDPQIADNWLNPFIILTAILIAIATFFALIFPLMDIVSKPKSGLIALGVIAAFGILFAISYSFASGNTDADYYVEFNINSTWSRLIEASIYMTYMLSGLAILSLLGSGISKFLKK